MSGLVPLSTYNLAVKPFRPVQAVHDGYPVTVRLTLAAVDPEPVEEGDEPSTLRILKKKEYEDSDEEDEDYDDEESDGSGDEDEEEEDKEKLVDDEAEEEKPKKKSSKSKKSQEEEDEEEEEEEDDDDEEEESEEDDDEEDDDEDVGEFVLCTLSPKVQYQQALDFTITPDEEVYFVVTGSYPVHLSGNYVEHPADTDEEDYEDDDEENLTPDEEDVLDDESYDLDDLENEPNVENKIEELVDEDDEKKQKKRSAEEEEEKPEKKSKKSKKDGKKVQFSQQLEQGPSETVQQESKNDKSSKNKDESKDNKSSSKKFPTETLFGGVVIEDRKKGSGPTAKDNNKVAIRYIGKLKNGSVFDKNTSGKPFSFKLGKGECIKGFDIGVSGMAAGGERRIIIPPKMGYGSKALPGLPANSELVFDVKLVSIK